MPSLDPVVQRDTRVGVGKITKRVIAGIRQGVKNLTKTVSMFYITARKIYKSIKAGYHNVKNEKMKLFSLGFVSRLSSNMVATPL
jgi:hypothetical protein